MTGVDRLPLRSKLLEKVPEIDHAFGTRHHPVGLRSLDHWGIRRPAWKQVHGVKVREARKPREELGDCDVLFTRAKRLPIGVAVADCVPILLAREDGAVVAAVHAGWRGTIDGAARALLERLAREGESLERYFAAIGPSIGPCCYEVDEALAERFARAGYQAVGETPGAKPKLDLPEYNRRQLVAYGLKSDRVEVLKACTLCDPERRFYSYRREKDPGRQFAAIVLGVSRGASRP